MPVAFHSPRLCRSCKASIYWAQLVDEQGEFARNEENGRIKAIPVDVEPVQNGNIVLADRQGTIVARYLRAGETPPMGGRLRVSHFASCPNAKQHRKRGRRCLIL